MPIQKEDIRLMASQELSDNASGGGAMTGNEVVDGNVNNLFSDISRLDRTVGRVSLRKAFVAVQTQTMDTYYGSHMILTDPPDDSGISVTIFSTGDFDDRRDSAKNYIEGYVVRSVLSRARLYENQLAGQKVILLIQSSGLGYPEIGEVYNLVENEGAADEYEQFIRVTDVSVETQSFNDGSSNYDLDVITLQISDPLRHTFHGGLPAKNDVTAQANDAAVFRNTSVADSAKYYSVAKLAADAVQNDLTINVDSIYAHIVPSAQSETALADASAAGNAIRLVTSSGNSFTTPTISALANTPFFVGMAMQRKSITITEGSSMFVDDGAGAFTRTTGSSPSVFTVVDYLTGEIQCDSNATVTVTYTPAVAVTDISETDEIEITIANRSTTYVKTLNPPPSPGSLQIDYMALGKWYRLRDQGDGSVIGDIANTGVASINYATGTVTLTLAALPDVDTSILFGWGGGNHYEIRQSDPDINPPSFHHTVADGSFAPGSVTVSWLSESNPYSVTDDGAGALTGNGSGSVNYQTGEIYLVPNNIPDNGSQITVDYDSGPPITEVFTPSAVAGDVTVNLSGAPVRPGSIRVQWHTNWMQQGVRSPYPQRIAYGNTGMGRIMQHNGVQQRLEHSAADDGVGALIDVAGSSVNHSTGQIVFAPAEGNGYFYNKYDSRPSQRIWSTTANDNDGFSNGSNVTVSYYPASGTPATKQDLVTPSSLTFQLMPKLTNSILPGSVCFEIGATTYVDRDGGIYADIDPSTNTGTLAGAIDYASGIVTLTSWTGAANGITVKSLLTQYGDWSMYDVRFRTAGSPLQSLSFYVQALKTSDGSLIDDTADANGDLATVDIEGRIDINNGIARVKFGRWVVAAGNEGEPWYDVAELDGQGNVWQPETVIPSSIKYNAVVYSYLPINADLIGIDPVRLPSDGRVPVFRPGDVAVVHSTTSEAMPGGLVADQQVVLSGANWSLIELYDQDGLQVNPTLYTVDLATSTVTMANPLDLSAYTQPLIAYKRIEDMLLISDVQINGKLTFTSPLQHDYLAADTYVSGALIFGDLASRYFNFFTQQTWTGEWSDNRIGDGTTAQYNIVTYPFQVRNDGAIEERWALKFTSPTTFDIVGETVGVIGSGASDGAPGTFIEPINPQTGQPYFRIQSDGFGAGWSTGNVIRFNTESANDPVWFNRTTLPGPEEQPTDQFTAQIRGDAD